MKGEWEDEKGRDAEQLESVVVIRERGAPRMRCSSLWGGGQCEEETVLGMNRDRQ